MQQILHIYQHFCQGLTFESAELQMRYASMLQWRSSSFRLAQTAWAGLTSVVARAFPSFLLCLGMPFTIASDPFCVPKMQCFRLGQSSPMDWQSLAMNSTEVRQAGLGLGEAVASSDWMEDRMWRTQARQSSRKASSTAGESMKRLKDDSGEFSEGPEEVTEAEMESDEQTIKGN